MPRVKAVAPRANPLERDISAALGGDEEALADKPKAKPKTSLVQMVRRLSPEKRQALYDAILEVGLEDEDEDEEGDEDER